MCLVDRKVTIGGGVVLFIRENLRSSIDIRLSSEQFEDSVWCSIQMYEMKLLLSVCYRSPQSPAEIIRNYYQ